MVFIYSISLLFYKDTTKANEDSFQIQDLITTTLGVQNYNWQANKWKSKKKNIKIIKKQLIILRISMKINKNEMV